MIGEDFPVLGHDVDAHIEESQAREHQDVVLCVLVQVLQEVIRHVSPVDSRVNVVRHVVPIVECVLVVRVVYRLVRQSTIKLKRFQILLHCCN